jgi:hypothetical protein
MCPYCRKFDFQTSFDQGKRPNSSSVFLLIGKSIECRLASIEIFTEVDHPEFSRRGPSKINSVYHIIVWGALHQPASNITHNKWSTKCWHQIPKNRQITGWIRCVHLYWYDNDVNSGAIGTISTRISSDQFQPTICPSRMPKSNWGIVPKWCSWFSMVQLLTVCELN